MSQVNLYGMVLYLFLALAGGFLGGLFSRYVYQLAAADLGRHFATLFAAIFYVAPMWALYSLFSDDDLDVFYLLLIVSFIYGVYFYKRFKNIPKPTERKHYFPPDEDD
jgi:Ca2+/Na+ antiporter